MTREELLDRNEMLINAYEICGCEKLRRLIVVTEIALLATEPLHEVAVHPDLMLEIEGNPGGA